jgi:glycosyltransferase involved in cell wall biosynthesis
MSDKLRVLFSGPVGTRSGYGSHARDLVYALINIDKYDVYILPQKWGNTPENALSSNNERDKKIMDRLIKAEDQKIPFDISFQVTVPNEFQKWAKYNIGVTAGFEATLVPNDWIQGANNADLVLFSSVHGLNSVANSKFDMHNEQKQKVGELQLTTKSEVLFEGVDTEVYKKTTTFSEQLVKEVSKIKESFCFLFVGHWLQGGLGEDRKDTAMLVKTFLESFKDIKNPPALIMKTSGADFSILSKAELLKKISNIKKTVKAKTLPNIYVLYGELEDSEMNDLYNHPKVKAHITFTHGEGFGRPLLEASLSGKPVIASAWSGHVDFLNKNNATLLTGQLTTVPKAAFPKQFLVEGQQWFTVNYSVASSILKDIFKKYKKYALPAKKLAIYNKSKFSLKAMQDKLEKILDENIPNFPKQVKLKLPKLKKAAQKAPTVKLPKLKKVN